LGIITPTDFHIFSEGVETTNQKWMIYLGVSLILGVNIHENPTPRKGPPPIIAVQCLACFLSGSLTDLCFCREELHLTPDADSLTYLTANDGNGKGYPQNSQHLRSVKKLAGYATNHGTRNLNLANGNLRKKTSTYFFSMASLEYHVATNTKICVFFPETLHP